MKAYSFPTFPGMYRQNNVPHWQRMHQTHDGLRQWEKVSGIFKSWTDASGAVRGFGTNRPGRLGTTERLALTGLVLGAAREVHALPILRTYDHNISRYASFVQSAIHLDLRLTKKPATMYMMCRMVLVSLHTPNPAQTRLEANGSNRDTRLGTRRRARHRGKGADRMA